MSELSQFDSRSGPSTDSTKGGAGTPESIAA